MHQSRPYIRRALAWTFILVLGSTSLGNAFAGTLVHVRTSLGEFYLELNDEEAPVTVANFLNYVQSGRYNNTVIHTVTGGTWIRGGSYTYNNCGQPFNPIQTDPPIPLEATGLSNLAGTLAMRRQANEPDGATSEWFINIGNDIDLDTRDGGYAVFGRVIGDGMDVVESISIARGLFLGFIHDTPTQNYFDEEFSCDNFTGDNLIQVLMSVVDDDEGGASSSFDSATGRLNVNVDLGSEGFTNLSFSLVSTEPSVVIEADLSSVVDLSVPVQAMASYDSVSGQLRLPALLVDGEVSFRNVVFTLSGEQALRFTLSSSE